MKPGMPFEPGLHSWMLVGTIIVYNQIKIQSEGGFSIYLLEETDKLLVSMTRHAVADNFAVQHTEIFNSIKSKDSESACKCIYNHYSAG